MALAGTVKPYEKKFKFVVEIDGVQSAAFQKVSELSVEIAKHEHWEGGSSVPNKSPGRLTFADVTLERGATKTDSALYDWVALTTQFSAAGVGSLSVGLPDPLYKRNLDIVQLDRDGSEMKRWTLFGAWPTKFTAGDGWDNGSDENVIESLTLTYDFFERTF